MPDGSYIQERDPLTVPSIRRNTIIAKGRKNIHYYVKDYEKFLFELSNIQIPPHVQYLECFGIFFDYIPKSKKYAILISTKLEQILKGESGYENNYTYVRSTFWKIW